jgi:SAM-dependent methyltransferase
MDMAEIEPLMRAVPRLLRSGGRFVFSVWHPVFNSGNFEWSFEAEDREGEYIERRAVKIWDYLEPSAKPGLAMIGQPVDGYYMHRPLSLLLKAAFEAGLVVDALEEPAYPPSDELARNRLHSWQNFPLIPPTLIVRLRPTA